LQVPAGGIRPLLPPEHCPSATYLAGCDTTPCAASGWWITSSWGASWTTPWTRVGIGHEERAGVAVAALLEGQLFSGGSLTG
jgi:hypothetical protein